MKMTIVPSDSVIGVDGVFLNLDFEAPANVHAIQIDDNKAEIEYNDGTPNEKLTGQQRQAIVDQYSAAYTTEANRIEAERAAAQAAQEALENSYEYRYAKKIEALYRNIKQFLEFQPNGFIRYDADLKLNILGAMLQAQAAGQPIPALCAAFQTWVTAVQMEFLTLKAQIDGGNLDVDVSYDMFEGKYGREGLVLPDPHVTTAALLGQ